MNVGISWISACPFVREGYVKVGNKTVFWRFDGGLVRILPLYPLSEKEYFTILQELYGSLPLDNS